MDASNITGYTTALNGLSAKQAELVLSTKGLSTAQQQAILNELSLASATGKLTTSQMTELLTTKSRSKADAEALLLNAGLITSETAEATATNVVTAAKLKELVQTKTLTQAEADLIAAKAGVTLANQKESASFLTGIGTKIKGLGSGLKSAGTGILALAKAHPVIAGITTALTIGTVAVGIYKKKQEEAAQAIKEAYEEAKTTIDEINSSFKNTKSSTEEIAEEYAELAQGVNLLTNENKKLSTENYERFLELSNQLSELYPSLTKGFDENGNAILDLGGDVNTIVGSLTDLVSVQEQLANQEIVKQMPALFEGYSNNVSNLNEDLETAQKTKEEIQRAYEVLNNWDSSTVWWNNGGNVSGTGTMGEYINALETLGITYKKVAVDLDNDLYHNTDGFSVEADYNQYGTELHDIYVDRFSKASDEVKYAKMQLESETSSINQYLNTWLQTEFSYNRLDDTGLQQAIQETLFNFDWSSLPKDVDKDDWDEVSEYLRRNILFSINNIDDTEVSKALSDIYTGNLTSGEMLDAITKVQSYFGESHPISLSLEPKVEDIEPLVNNVKDKLKGTEFDDRVGELSLGDLQIAADLEVPDDSIQSWDDLLERIQKVKDETFDNETAVLSDIFSLKNADDELTELGKINEEIDNLKSACSTLKKTMDSYNKTGTFTIDQVQDIIALGDDYLKYLMDENGNLQLNEEALNKVAVARVNEMRAKTLSSLMDNLDAIKNEETALSYLEEQLLDTAEAYNIMTESRIAAWYTNNLDISESTRDAVVESVRKQVSAINKMFDSISLNSFYESTSSSASSAADTAKDLISAYMKLQEKSLEKGLIDYKTYSNTVSNYLKKMWNDGKISAQEYYDYTGEMLEYQKSIYDKVLSAVTERYDEEIDKINDVIDSVEELNEALQKQLDDYDRILSVVESVYDKQIQALEDEKDLLQEKIDAINDTNDALDLQYRKEQAIYELKRSQEQRTKKVFNGTEFVFETDKEAIRDAQKTLQDIETEELISNLEKEQEALDAEIKKLEEFKEKWAEITDAYDTEINTQLAISLWGKEYESIILSNRLSDIESFKDDYVSVQKQIDDNQGLIDSYNEKIEYYENLKEQWSSIADEYEKSVNRQLAAQILGANWEQDILNGRIDTLNNFASDYYAIQQSIIDMAWHSANEQIKAAQKAASGTIGSAANVTSTVAKQETIISSGNNGTGNSTVKYQILTKYGTGTENAKQGIHEVSEKGDEIIVDNNDNAFLAKGRQLHYFEGGETVINAADTEKLLENHGLVPVVSAFDGIDTSKLVQNLQPVTPNFKTFDYSALNNVVVKQQAQPSINIGDIHLHEVQNVRDFGAELNKYLPNISVQYNGNYRR